MKAALLHAPGKMLVKEVPPPERRGPGLLCEIVASGICGSDLRSYVSGPGAGRAQPGHEVVLRVVSLSAGEGTGVAERALLEYETGTRLCVSSVSCGVCRYCVRGDEHMCGERTHVGFEAPSGFSELAFVPLRTVLYGSVFPVPSGVSSVTASLVEPLACVLCGHEKVEVSPGDTVIILGAGPVGCMHGMMAGMRGASRVVMVDVRQRRLELVPPGSCHIKLNAGQTQVEEAVLELTGGSGADLVVVACAGPEAHAASVRLVRKGGQILFFSGLARKDRIVPIDVDAIHRREIRLVGSRNAGRRHFKLAMETLARPGTNFASVVSHVIPLDRVDEGFQMALKGEAMKVVVVPKREE